LDQNFDPNIDKMHIPESLEQLQFGDNFDQPIANIIFPNSLKKYLLVKILVIH
jgi:hypothetical protein